MKATTMRRMAVLVSVASAILLVSTLALPYVKYPESTTRAEPSWTGPPGSYQVYGFGIPPVDQGSSVTVNMSGYNVGDVEYSLSPTMGNLILTALASGKVASGPTFSLTVIAKSTYSLELMVIAYNGTGVTIEYSGVWSPYDNLQVYTSPAVFVLAAGLVSVYYFGTQVPRQLAEEKVERELEASRSSG